MNLNKFTAFSLVLFTAISLTFPNSASASTPVVLRTGESTTFPTWEGSKSTQLCVISRANAGGSVRINAGAEQETLQTPAQQKTCIERKWGGIIIGVTNQGVTMVEVWTS